MTGDAERASRPLFDRFRVDGRIAVVTGGSRGIGRAISIGLAEAGADVVVASRDMARTLETAREVAHLGRRGIGIACDVADPASVESLFARVADELGGVDLFVHCAGVARMGAALTLDREMLAGMMDIHYFGGVRAAQLAAQQMMGRGGGAMLFVTSIWGLGGQPYALAYGGAKAALANAVKTLAIEWAKHGIRVNGLAPGLVETDMTADVRGSDELHARMLKSIPLRRGAAADEMAGPALFLLSDAASYVTGEILVADGGTRAR